jgi:hypothetical protein
VRIIIYLDQERASPHQPPAGVVGWGGVDHPFSGWVQLLKLLETALNEARTTAEVGTAVTDRQEGGSFP